MKTAKNIKIPYRIVIIVLSAIFAVSTVFAVTLAYLQSNQHRTDYMEVANNKYAVYLQKYEINAQGDISWIPVKGAEFVLFRITPDLVRIQVNNTTYSTDDSGAIMIEGLDKGDYLFLETNPTYAYDYYQKDGHEQKEFCFTIDDANKDEDVIHVAAYNQRAVADLSIKKLVKNSDESPLTAEQLGQEFVFTFTLTDNTFPTDALYEYTVDSIAAGSLKSGDTFKLKHNQTSVIQGLPVGVSYSITETPIAGYTISSSINTNGNLPREGAAAFITNTCSKNYGSLVINKTVIGSANDDTEFEFVITFEDGGSYVYKISGDDTEYTLSSGGVVKLKDGQSAVFLNLPAGLGYKVTEKSLADYTAAVLEYTGEICKTVTLPFVNHKNHGGTTGYLTVSKSVVDHNSATDEFQFNVTFSDSGSATTPASLTYKINGIGVSIPFTNGGKITLKDGQHAVFENLPAGLVYTVTEDEALGYISTVGEVRGAVPESATAAVGAKVPFVNVKDNKIKLVVRKLVDIPNPEDMDKAFEFTVKINGIPQIFSLKNGQAEEIILSESDTYEVEEKNYFSEGYIQTTVITSTGTKSDRVITATVTNTYVKTICTIISGKKIWDFGSYTDVQKPPYIRILVKDGDITVAEKIVTQDDNWEWSFRLPQFRADGTTLIDYTLYEQPVNGFETTVNGFDIINKYVPVPTTLNIPLAKDVVGDPDTPQSFTFTLEILTPNAPLPSGHTNGKKTVTILGEGRIDFGDIVYVEEGTYVYLLREQSGSASGYTYDETFYIVTVIVRFESDNKTLGKTVIYEKDTDGGKVAVNNVSAEKPLLFTNIYTHSTPTETDYTPAVSKSITGNAIPAADDVFEFKIEASVSANPMPTPSGVQITGEGTANFGGITFAQPGIYNYIITETKGSIANCTYDESVYTLTVTVTRDANGNLIATPKYVKNGTTNAVSVAAFVNRYDYTPTGETITIKGHKVWRHGDNHPDFYPDSITIYLKANNQTILQKTVTEKEHWEWSFEVDRYDADGKEIVYTIEESPIQTYRTQISGFNIINRHSSVPEEPDEPPVPSTETVTIKGEKIWNHMGNPKASRPESITVYLYNGNQLEASQIVTAKEGWSYTFTVLKYDKNNNEIQYRIDEASVKGYGKYINGYDLINTYGYQDNQTPPKTADESNIHILFAVMFTSLSALIILVISGAKSKKRASKVFDKIR